MKQSWSMLQGLRLGTSFVEFRQLREVWVFFYLDILCLKAMKMVLGVVKPEMAMDFGSKEVEPMLDEGAVMDSPCTVMGLLKSPG